MFNVGDKIVYPMHGAGTIDSIEVKMKLKKLFLFWEKTKQKCLKIGIRDIEIIWKK